MVDFFVKQIYKQKQFVKYGISGGIAFSTDLLLLFLFTDLFNLWYLFSAVLAFSIAFFVSFFLQKFWTFRDAEKEGMYSQMGMYFVVGVINLAINTAGMYLLVDHLHIMYIISQIIMGAFIAIGSFIVYKFVIFRRVRKKEKIKTRNVLIATGIFPPDIGGPATMLEALAKDLIKNDFQVKILTYADNSEKSDSDLEVYRIDKNKRWRKFSFLKKMYKLADWADVLYVTDTYSVGYSSYLVNKYLDKKYILRFAGDSAWEVATSEGLTDDYIVDFQDKKYQKEIEDMKEKRNKIMKNADTIIAVSNFMKNLAVKIGVKEEKIKTIYNSTDFLKKENIEDGDVAELKNKYGRDKKMLVTSCRLTAWKGVDGIIKVLPEIKKEIGVISFLVLGDGPEMENLKRLSHEMGVDENVHFLGRIKHSETMKYFKAADLYILNTNYEGLSHALLDVMGVGAPIVTTRVGGNSELIEDGENGFLVGYNNKEELLNACIKILKDEDLQNKFIQKSKEKLKKFSWENTVNETVKILNKYV